MKDAKEKLQAWCQDHDRFGYLLAVLNLQLTDLSEQCASENLLYLKDESAELVKIAEIDGNLAVFVLDRMPEGFVSLGIDGLERDVLEGKERK